MTRQGTGTWEVQQLFPALHCLPVAHPSICATCPEPECQQAGGASVTSRPMGLAQRLQTGEKHRQAQASPCTPSGPTAKAEQLGAASQGRVHGHCPRGASADLAHRPQTLLAWSGSAATSLSWAWVPRPVAKSSSHSYLSWMPWAPTRPGAGPGSPEADSPTARPGRLHTASLHDGCSCPHPPALGSP